jgi:methyl-accepting chemotaxis protein
MSGLMTEIASAAQEQATGLGQVNAAVNQMDKVTQQNAAMVEQSTAASHSLAGEAQELTRLVGQFRTGAVPTSRAPRAAPHKVSAAPPNAVSPKIAPPKIAARVAADRARPAAPREIVPAVKRAPAIQGPEENWSEF